MSYDTPMPKTQKNTGFGPRLKLLREAAGLSQAVLAAKVGMNRFSLSKLELGSRQPTWSTVIDLADALGVSTEQFRDKKGRAAK